ncbi:MAG: hypothetical protein GEU93_20845 [Propionibacteriales bacterium]|nr:hypothetical protein [Propionibacteriales bacterium]
MRHALRSAVTLVLSAGVLFSGAGCSGDEPEPPAAATPKRTPTGAATALVQRSAPYDVGLRSVAGDLRKRDRERATRLLARPVRTWVDNGFLDRPWRRPNLRATFAGFTPDLRGQARRQAGRLTMSRLGNAVTEVIAQRRSIRLRGFAPRGRVMGGTAVVDLRFLAMTRDGEVRRVNVRGDLSLTRMGTPGKVRIFAYDLDRWVDRNVSVVGEDGA